MKEYCWNSASLVVLVVEPAQDWDLGQNVILEEAHQCQLQMKVAALIMHNK